MGDTLSKPVTDKYSCSYENDMMAVGATGMQGWRRSMEDAHSCILKLEGSEKGPCSFFGVYDGHCGQNAARYCGKLMHDSLSGTTEFKEGNWQGAMKRGFLDLDAKLNGDPACDASGCTAVCCLVTSDGQLVVGNAGDSRAVLSRGGTVKALSFDHKPTNTEETQRITKAGAFVNGGRVNGNLALSRAVGDFAFKQNASLPPEEQAITANPEITVTPLTPEDEFIVLACDGIWDVMTNEEVVDFVKERLGKQELAKVCEDACDRCLAVRPPGLGCDNMTFMIVSFKDRFKQHVGLNPMSTASE